MINVNTVVDEIVGKLASEVVGSFSSNTSVVLKPELATELAKALGFIKANKGRVGGFMATSEGLAFVEVDEEEYNNAVKQKTELQSLERKIANLQKKKEEALNSAAIATPVEESETSTTVQ